MIVTRALPVDCDLLALHRCAPGRYPSLLQSTSSALQASQSLARWEMLLVADGERLRLTAAGELWARDRNGSYRNGSDRNGSDRNGGDRNGGEPNGSEYDEPERRCDDDDFLTALDARWRALRVAREEPRWPFRGGWALLLGYELAAQVEPVLRLPAAAGELPVAIALRCPAAVLRDRATGECVAIAETGREDLLDVIVADVARCATLPVPVWRPPIAVEEDPPQAFLDGVDRILEYLAAGDVFQVNLSRGWRARFAAADAAPAFDPAALYARLRAASPAPFAGMFAGEGWAVVSSSPERLVSIRGDLIETRPIAGTRPRFPGDDDAARIRELVGHPKERAEHVMLIDLERNDLGRVCVPGSVEVDELMTVESYAHVHHIVSNVRGRLRAEVTPGEAIRAVFPGGTITGCPKVRCMQIIAELEGIGRGVYTGAMGWLNRDGDLDLNILIRSAEIEHDAVERDAVESAAVESGAIESGAGGHSVLRFRTGAGIVADSDPLRELDETRAKARGLLKALGVES